MEQPSPNIRFLSNFGFSLFIDCYPVFLDGFPLFNVGFPVINISFPYSMICFQLSKIGFPLSNARFPLFIDCWVFLFKKGKWKKKFVPAINPLFLSVEWNRKGLCDDLDLGKLRNCLTTYHIGKLPLGNEIWFLQYFVTYKEFFLPKKCIFQSNRNLT